MEFKEFFKKIVVYYGQYDSTDKAKIVWEWVAKNIPKKDLQNLFKRVIEHYSSKWKTPPDAQIFIECTEPKDREERAMIDFIKEYSTPIQIEHIDNKKITGGID